MKQAGTGSSYEVTVLVITYHPAWEKLRQTLISAMLQKDVRCQIVIADDGSDENHRDRILSLFREYAFTEYTLVLNDHNQGTVANYLSGLRAAEGEYTKGISPGDFFSGPFVLREWLNDLKSQKTEWSF